MHTSRRHPYPLSRQHELSQLSVQVEHVRSRSEADNHHLRQVCRLNRRVNEIVVTGAKRETAHPGESRISIDVYIYILPPSH